MGLSSVGEADGEVTVNEWLAVFLAGALWLTGLNAYLDYIEEGRRGKSSDPAPEPVENAHDQALR